MKRTSLILAIDTGGTTVKCGYYLLSPAGELSCKETRDLKTCTGSVEGHVEQIAPLIKTAMDYAEEGGYELVVQEACPGQFKRRGSDHVIDLCYIFNVKNESRTELKLENAIHFPTLYRNKLFELLGGGFGAKARLDRISIDVRNDVEVQSEGLLPLMWDELPELSQGKTDICLVMLSGTGEGGAVIERSSNRQLTHMNNGEVGRLMINYMYDPRVRKAFGDIGFNENTLHYPNIAEVAKFPRLADLESKGQPILIKNGTIHANSAVSGGGAIRFASSILHEHSTQAEKVKLLKALGILKTALIAQIKHGQFLNAAGTQMWERHEALAAQSFTSLVLGGGFMQHDEGKVVISTIKEQLPKFGVNDVHILIAPKEHASLLVAKVAAESAARTR